MSRVQEMLRQSRETAFNMHKDDIDKKFNFKKAQTQCFVDLIDDVGKPYMTKILQLREEQKLISEFDNYDLIAENMFNLLLNQPKEEIFFEKSKLFINDKDEMWNSRDTITHLKKQFPEFEYISNFEVTKISQTGDVINIVSKKDSLIFKNSKLNGRIEPSLVIISALYFPNLG